MRNGSIARRLVVAALALACVSLAVMWPTWRTVLAQVGGYPGDESSFLGCATNKAGDLVVVFPSGLAGPDCSIVLNDAGLAGCKIEKQTQEIDLSRGEFGAMFHITCPTAAP